MSRFGWLGGVLCCASLWASAGWTQSPRWAATHELRAQRLQQEFFSEFNLADSAADADELLRRQPGDVTALFVRMETAVLQQRTDAVLDSALRLCSMAAPAEIQEIASSRILENAANSRVFDEVLRRVGLAMEENNACTFNLRLALVAAATDGNSHLDLDKTAASAGLLTRWRIAGPFGQSSNVDFERYWPAESEQFWIKPNPAAERFWFRDGMVALPEYFSGPGVFYAAADVRTATPSSQLDVLSAGPYTIFIDGKQVLAKDSRFSMSGNRESVAMRAKPGRHRIVVKFTSDAAPFSVDLQPAFGKSHPRSVPTAPAMAEYIRALLEYFRGNFNAVEQTLASAESDRGPLLYIRALLWSAVEDHSPRARAAWEAFEQAEPSALLAQVRALEFALDGGPTDEQRARIRDLEQRRPESEAVAELSLKSARGDHNATAEAFRRLLGLHPTCARLSEALKFYTASSEQTAAGGTEDQLSRCAPESLEYARVLSDSGRHEQSATLLQQKVAQNGLNRAARRMLVQELVLSGHMNEAREEAKKLQRVAPGSRLFARIADDPMTVLDSNSERGANFVSGKEFYVPFRRSAADMIREAAGQDFSGSAIAVLLMDRVLKLHADGSASLYLHRVTRLLNKDGISRYGEVALPHGADLLELRTIKSTGQVMEPELPQQKATISMPALEPGASIEEEYVTHYPDWRHLPPDPSRFEFGSVAAPVMRSRLVLSAPKAASFDLDLSGGAPHPRVELNQGGIVRTWELDDMSVVAGEPFSPDGSLLPAVTFRAAEGTLDRLRDELIDSTRIGPHVIEAAVGQKFTRAMGEREKARVLYRFVTSRIESTGPDLDNASAEDTLATGVGSRTATLLALARAAGVKAELLMARRIDHICPTKNIATCYREPVVRFWADGEVIDADAEADNLPFGAVSAGLNPDSALLVPLQAPSARMMASTPQLVSLSIRRSEELSVAEGDLFLDGNGTLTASLHVRLGAARSQEVRTNLVSRTEHERQSYFEQFAARIFPGATAVQADAVNLSDPEQPLELTLRCRAPQFINMQPGTREINQLAPALGLHIFAGKPAQRRFPLLVDAVLFESTVFHLHLPTGVAVSVLPHDFVTSSDFGEYAVRFVQRRDGQIDITREFGIPIQVVQPEHFPAFMQFADGIAAAEQQPIGLEVRETAAEKQGDKRAAD